MLAPAGLNLDAQNRGVERFIRASDDAGIDVRLDASVKGRRLAIPLADGSFEYVDVLTQVSYTIHRRTGGPLLVTLEVTPPPNGTWDVVRNDIPEGAPGGEILDPAAR